MARILFVQPSFQPPGGGNGVAAWMLQALVAEHAVTVLTWQAVDFHAINRFYGTSIRAEDVTLRLTDRASYAVLERVPSALALMKSAILAREARRLGDDFDLTVTANNEAEFGRPNIQYIHYPTFLRPRPHDDIRWYHHPEVMLDLYYWLADRLLQTSHDRLIGSRTLVNSDWTGDRFVERHGGRTETVYPPIPTDFPDVPWEARANGFVCLGRIAQDKRVEIAVDIVEAVRRHQPDAHLHIIGSPGAGREYYRRLLRRVRGLAWVTVHEDIARDEVLRLIATHRYGLHAKDREHFGMAPAEMVCGGCLVWVHDSGGQVEIVGRDPRFTFTSAADAAEKILAIWDDPDAQRAAHAALAGRREMFSIDRFQARVRDIAREMLMAPRDPRSAT